MGIPRFFRFINEQFPHVAKSTSFNSGFKLAVDNLYLDANGILHNCSREIYFSKTPRLARSTNGPVNKETMVFKAITAYIDQLLQYVKPRKVFYIAIDGPAPLAKQSQQRQRRYKAALEKTEDEMQTFDSTCITPGTVFMERVSKFICEYIKKRVASDPQWGAVTVIFSGPDVPGEGEHKIVQYIREQPSSRNDVHCMYGLDADLFMLSLATHCPKFYLLREDQFRTVWNDTLFYTVDIKKLRRGLIEKWGGDDCKSGDSLINDFIFICFMAGNDFLHSLPACHDLSESIDFLMDLRLQTLKCEFITAGPQNYNLGNLTEFLSQLAKSEVQIISGQFYHQNFPNLTLNSSLENPLQPSFGINLAKYRELYYKKANVDHKNIKQVRALCKNYIQGLEWVHYYYHNKPKNWGWYYPYHYSPLVTDLVEYLTTTTKLSRVSTKEIEPIKPFEQLLCVVPPRSKNLLPTFLQGMYTGILKEWFPLEFPIDLEGKTREWEGIGILPFIDIQRIREEYPKGGRNLKRNNFGVNHIFKK